MTGPLTDDTTATRTPAAATPLVDPANRGRVAVAILRKLDRRAWTRAALRHTFRAADRGTFDALLPPGRALPAIPAAGLDLVADPPAPRRGIVWWEPCPGCGTAVSVLITFSSPAPGAQ